MRRRGRVLHVFKELIEDRRGKPYPRRARWRESVRIEAQRLRIGFADAFLWTMYGGGRMTKMMELMLSSPAPFSSVGADAPRLSERGVV
jgi:hypothetical protein